MTENDGAAPPAQPRAYMPQLDALRALALSTVLLTHWFPGNALSSFIPIGSMGVTLFFVLSGYLITRLLLEERDAPGFESGPALGRFYLRRTLRIFPAYYLTVLLVYLSYPGVFRADIGWYLAYASNFLFYDAQAWTGPAPHLWTLAVEEQFYLGWPLVVLFAPRASLSRLMFLLVALGPLSRVLLFHFSDGSPAAADFAHVLMPTCLDCFGLGALLACRRQDAPTTASFRSIGWKLFLVANAVSLLSVKDSQDASTVLLFRFNAAVLATELIARASNGYKGRVGRLLESPWLVYLGRISYGLYLFHISTPALYAWLGLPLPDMPALRFLAWLALLALLGALSWYAFERPLNRLGHRFRHRVAATPRAGVPGVVK